MDDLHLMQEFESGIGNNKTVFCRHPEIIHLIRNISRRINLHDGASKRKPR